MEQLTHITLLSPETAKHLQVPMIMMTMSMITMTMIMMMTMIIINITVIKSSFCLHRTWLSPRSLT